MDWTLFQQGPELIDCTDLAGLNQLKPFQMSVNAPQSNQQLPVGSPVSCSVIVSAVTLTFPPQTAEPGL